MIELEEITAELFSGKSPSEVLRLFLEDLQRLNPDYSVSVLQCVKSALKRADKGFFDEALPLVERVIELYLASPQKTAGAEILSEYYDLLDSEERRLMSAGELPELPPVREELRTESACVALVPARDREPLNRYLVLTRSDIPQQLMCAVDSYSKRNAIVDTVMELALNILWSLDAARAGDWGAQFFEAHAGTMDPDVIRDFMRVAHHQKNLPAGFMKWVVRWCGDSRLLEHWPVTVYTCDKVLCLQGIQKLLANTKARTASIAHLALLFREGKTDDNAMQNWVETALTALADSVCSIMSIHEQADELSAIHRASLLSELRRMKGVHPFVMLACNYVLSQPDGVHQFAMALFGLAGDGLRRWCDALNDFCKGVIKRLFILDMRGGRTPVETIRRLTFGNDDAFRMAMAELDLVSERFDSPAQRDKVVALLVPIYASYRQEKLLAAEVTKRYRKIARMLHEDYLRQHLSGEEYESVCGDGSLREISGLVGDARKFLDRRRDLAASVEKILAARVEYEEQTRHRRLAAVPSF